MLRSELQTYERPAIGDRFRFAMGVKTISKPSPERFDQLRVEQVSTENSRGQDRANVVSKPLIEAGDAGSLRFCGTACG